MPVVFCPVGMQASLEESLLPSQEPETKCYQGEVHSRGHPPTSTTVMPNSAGFGLYELSQGSRLINKHQMLMKYESKIWTRMGASCMRWKNSSKSRGKANKTGTQTLSVAQLSSKKHRPLSFHGGKHRGKTQAENLECAPQPSLDKRGSRAGHLKHNCLDRKGSFVSINP